MRLLTALLLGLFAGPWGGAVLFAQDAETETQEPPVCEEGVEPETDEEGNPSCVVPEEGVVTLKTSDGWTIEVKWVPPPETEEESEAKEPPEAAEQPVPGLEDFVEVAYEKPKVLVLLHMASRRRQDWSNFGDTLSKKGYGWLAIDLRGHGGSLKNPEGEDRTFKSFRTKRKDRFNNEWNHMTRDVEAGFAFLQSLGYEENQIGLVGAGVGASVALKTGALHPEVKLLMLLSPGLRHREVLAVNPIRTYGKRPLLMVLATSHQGLHREGLLLGEVFKKASEERFLSILEVRQGYGTRLLLPETIDNVLAWLEAPIRPAEPEISTGTVDGVDSGRVMSFE